MNRHSILFKINVIFGIAFAAMLTVLLSLIFFQAKAHYFHISKKMPKVIHLIKRFERHGNVERFQAYLASHELKSIPPEQIPSILEQTTPVKAKFSGPQRKHPFTLRKGEKTLYVHFTTPRGRTFLLEDRSKPINRFYPAILGMGGAMLLLVLIYGLTRRSMKPIKHLSEAIRALGDGKHLITAESGKKDEVSQLADELFHTTQKMKRLSESRKLFLRNIMHELNTPVAKGKIIAAMSKEANQEILENIFDRLELLIQELANVEKISSGTHEIQCTTYRIIDIIDHANDLLFSDEEIPTDITSQTIQCDFELMGLVFKNLIDNGRKYGESFHINTYHDTLMFISSGEPLQHPFEYYLEPFTKGEGHEHSNGGLGLGLYIINEILARQHYTFTYRYHDGRNIFSIAPSPS